MVATNNPPSQIEFTQETAEALNAWLTEHPVILTEDDAREGKLLVDRSFLCLQDLDAERDGKVRPLNEQVKEINTTYREPKNLLDRIATELRNRLNAFVEAEESKREEIARKARQKAEEAERVAREAETAEEDARDDSRVGVSGDFAQATKVADAAFESFKRADRAANLAERYQAVKIGGGFRRSLSARNKETLTVDDPYAAVAILGWTGDMIMSIIKAAKSYRSLHQRLPPGIRSTTNRSL